MRSFDFLMDSSCDIPKDLAEEYGFRLLPMMILMEGKEYPEIFWQSLSAKDYYTALRNKVKASTSQVTREEFIRVFTEIAEGGRDVLFVPLSSGISGTHDAAASAARELSEVYPNRHIIVTDSLNATLGHGLLCMLAAQRADKGMGIVEVARWMEKKRDKVFALFTVDDLMYLHRGGRLGRMSAIAGSLLGIKPTLAVSPEGTLDLRGKVRGRKAALEELVVGMGKCVPYGKELGIVTISHGDCEEDAKYVAELVSQKYKVGKIHIGLLGAVISAHAGPGTVALFYEGDITREEYYKL
ncbi:hypothetical protein FACS1894202_12100 [Clostridia bacterium]|nr:hypothetical protein FACS1894202_12100 [Clostridia bacterium]